jgi:hypothetical protein
MPEHKATPKQWEVVGLCQEEGKIPWATATCLLELRARVEALEAREARWTKKVNRLAGVARETSESLFTNTAAMAELRASIAEAQPAPAGSLVERLAGAIHHSIDLEMESRAVLREIAAAARAKDSKHWDPSGVTRMVTWEMVAQWLEQEAGGSSSQKD